MRDNVSSPSIDQRWDSKLNTNTIYSIRVLVRIRSRSLEFEIIFKWSFIVTLNDLWYRPLNIRPLPILDDDYYFIGNQILCLFSVVVGQFIFIIIGDRSIEIIISISDSLACFGSLYFTRHSRLFLFCYLFKRARCASHTYPYVEIEITSFLNICWKSKFWNFFFISILLLYNWNVFSCRHFFIITFFVRYQFHISGNDGDTFNAFSF